MQQPKFETDAVRSITEQSIQASLNNQVYDHSSVNKWSSEILESTLRSLSHHTNLFHNASSSKKPVAVFTFQALAIGIVILMEWLQ